MSVYGSCGSTVRVVKIMATWWQGAALLLAAATGRAADGPADEPTYRVANGTIELIWQLPSRPLALVFVAHGGGNSARRFFPKSAACPVCNGYYDKICLVDRLVSAQLGVFIPSAPDRTFLNGRAWVPRGGWEFPRDSHVLDWAVRFAAREVAAPAGVPLVLLSQSSAVVSALDLLRAGHRFAAHLCQVPARLSPMLQGAPPTLFTYNPRDAPRAKAVREAVLELRRLGTPAAELKSWPHRVGPHFFAAVLGARYRLSPEQSTAMYLALKRDGFLDDDDFVVNFNPLPSEREVRRGERWKEALRSLTEQAPLHDSLQFHQSDVEGAMGVAFGFHGGRCDTLIHVMIDFVMRALLERPVWPRQWTCAHAERKRCLDDVPSNRARASANRQWLRSHEAYPEDEHL